MEVKNLDYVLADDFFLLCRTFSDSELPSISSSKKLLSCPYGWVPQSERQPKPVFLRNTCLFFSSAVVSYCKTWKAILFQGHLCLLQSFPCHTVHCAENGIWELTCVGNKNVWKITLIYSAITFLILHLYCTAVNKEEQECYKLVEQQTLSQSHDCFGLDFQVPSSSMLAVKCFAQGLGKRCRNLYSVHSRKKYI